MSELVGKTTYSRQSYLEAAPAVTDCLTSIIYIFKKALHEFIPFTFIGDMPRQFMRYGSWRLLSIDSSDAKCGDLIFVKSKTFKRLITHVALFVDNARLFHCTPVYGTAVIESSAGFFSRYEQNLSAAKALRYIDLRNRSLRDEYGGSFIKDE